MAEKLYLTKKSNWSEIKPWAKAIGRFSVIPLSGVAGYLGTSYAGNSVPRKIPGWIADYLKDVSPGLIVGGLLGAGLGLGFSDKSPGLGILGGGLAGSILGGVASTYLASKRKS